ncbi:MAG: methylenetetrahydrofolate--tRNA-(uracil(54)-C(5))-methyltransferase (FADH(2)-oxidizing) TrmFO [Fastidiosipilaceae bacterium]|jgi:methylenetetrahydrofolate--tRNA-(uracil-5-)-methyltransferase
MSTKTVTVVGAGLAGCEAALQIASRGIQVELLEMKPLDKSEAHKSDDFAELVCSNSFRAAAVENAVGLLKEELRLLGSELIQSADQHRLPAGGALAVDRDLFAASVTEKIKRHPLIHQRTEKVSGIPDAEIVVIATGPLTDGGLFEQIGSLLGMDRLYFFDAAAPIVTLESLDQQVVFRQSRYDKGGADYLNCPLDEQQYLAFYHELINAELADVKEFEREIVFEGCMPIETMAKRGVDTMRYGPLKPVGLVDPATGKMPYACVQLRQDDRAGTLYNLVGFQTRLKFGEQRRVFGLIPGLANAVFARYGVMHRNTFLHSPGFLSAGFEALTRPGLFFAGQMTGVEGYVESIASGLVAGVNAARLAKGGPADFILPPITMIGALSHYVSDPRIQNFQPMNANFGLIAPLTEKVKGKKNRGVAYAGRSLKWIEEFKKTTD